MPAAKQEFFILLVIFRTNNNHISIYSHEKSTISKKFPMQMVFFCLLFTKTIFSEKEIHGIIERGRMRQYRRACSEGYEKYKK